ncbi:MAG: hypothetical protein OXR66_01275 [Candidatus Woesearchaeota archaeon]|nr:hypothetical protein [Candidatus Woesearchaeota archaeon]
MGSSEYVDFGARKPNVVVYESLDDNHDPKRGIWPSLLHSGLAGDFDVEIYSSVERLTQRINASRMYPDVVACRVRTDEEFDTLRDLTFMTDIPFVGFVDTLNSKLSARVQTRMKVQSVKHGLPADEVRAMLGR